jgi:hypothetical protein
MSFCNVIQRKRYAAPVKYCSQSWLDSLQQRCRPPVRVGTQGQRESAPAAAWALNKSRMEAESRRTGRSKWPLQATAAGRRRPWQKRPAHHLVEALDAKLPRHRSSWASGARPVGRTVARPPPVWRPRLPEHAARAPAGEGEGWPISGVAQVA